MIILFESQSYKLETIEKLLPDELRTPLANKQAKTDFVGYYLAEESEEPVFILPKVFIDKNRKPFGKDNLTFDTLAESKDLKSILDEDEAATVSRLSFWLYQAIKKYKENNPNTTIVRTSNVNEIKAEDDANEYTLIDIIQSLRKFNHEHQDLFTFIVNTNRSGIHNIDWNKTIRKVQPILQDGEPIYLQFYNKKKNINFDEELIILFYSVIEYLKERYFFDEPVNFNFNLLPTYEIENMIDCCQGTLYLNKIRHKYFTDDLVKLWNLLYVFFDKAERIKTNNHIKEETLATSFNTVFEDMVDQLVGSTDPNIRNLRHNKDGKIIDHLYEDESLINNGPTYFIADSKYYKDTSDLGENSVYKQFTYAKNIIQYNLDIFHKDHGDTRYKKAMRDELTEGYNIVPNFFIRASAIGDKGIYDYKDNYLKNEFDADINGSYFDDESNETKMNKLVNYHFSNRLFDRDTLILQTYNINFLYVLAKYVEGEDEDVKAKIRKIFREDLIRRFDKLYNFYKLEPRDTTADLETLVDKHFRILNGRVICPSEDKEYLYLALERKSNKLDITKSSELKLKYSLIRDAVRDFKHKRFSLCKLNGIPQEGKI